MVLRSPSSRALAYYGGSLIVGIPLVIALKRFGASTDAVSTAVAAGAFFAAAHVAFLLFWRGLDEAARSAHKDAVFWGGLAWMGLLMVGYVTLAIHPLAMPPTPWGRSDPAAYVAAALGVSLLTFAVCYFAAWAVWWLRRR